MELSEKKVRNNALYKTFIYTCKTMLNISQENTNKIAYIKYIRMVAESRERGMKMGIKQTNDKLNFPFLDTENISNKNC